MKLSRVLSQNIKKRMRSGGIRFQLCIIYVCIYACRSSAAADHLEISGSVSCPAASSDGEPLLARASSIFLRSSGLEFKRLMLAKFFLWVRKPIPQIRIQRNRGRTTVRARLIRSRAADPGKWKMALTKASRYMVTSRITAKRAAARFRVQGAFLPEPALWLLVFEESVFIIIPFRLL